MANPILRACAVSSRPSVEGSSNKEAIDLADELSRAHKLVALVRWIAAARSTEDNLSALFDSGGPRATTLQHGDIGMTEFGSLEAEGLAYLHAEIENALHKATERVQRGLSS